MSHFTGNSFVGYLAVAAVALFAGSAVAATASSAAVKSPTAQTVVAVAPVGAVMIGDFAGKIRQNPKHGPYILEAGHGFGWGWATSTDRMMGGHSTATIALMHPGADGTKNALAISGEIKSGFPEPWAGAIWFPGHEPMQPANLAGKKELAFRAKGKPGDYRILVLAGTGYIPESASFTVTTKWKEYHILLAKSFPGADWKQVSYLVFSGTQPGKFKLDLDQVSLR